MQTNFSNWPTKGKFEPWTVLVTMVLIAVAYIGIGQIPLTIAILSKLDAMEVVNMSQRGFADLLGQNYFLTLILLPFVAVVGMMFIGIRYVHKTGFLSFLTGRDHFDFKRLFTAVLVWGGLQMLVHIIALATGAPIEWNYQGAEFWNLLLISLFILPIQSSSEELIFRSYLFKAFSGISYPLARIVLTGLLFGLMHGMNPEVEQLGNVALLFYIITGVFLGLITYLDNGMELALGYHAINNIFASVVVTNNWQVFQTPALWLDNRAPTFGWELIISLLIFQPLMFFLFYKLYKWDLRKIFSRV